MMKRSEKEKGKAAAAQRKKIYTIAGIAAGIIVVLVCVYFAYNVATPMTAKAGDTVGIFYTGSLDDGTVFDSNMNSTDKPPLRFVLGRGTMIPGMEAAVVGMTLNESKTVSMPPEKAYGLYHPELVQILNRSAIPSGTTVSPGDHFTIKRTDGAVSIIRVINVTSSGIAVDENHDLAGKNLTFEIRLAEIVRN